MGLVIPPLKEDNILDWEALYVVLIFWDIWIGRVVFVEDVVEEPCRGNGLVGLALEGGVGGTAGAVKEDEAT